MRAEFGTGIEPKNVCVSEDLIELNPWSKIREEIGDLYNQAILPVNDLKDRGVEILKESENKITGVGCFYFLFGFGYPPNQIEDLFNNSQIVKREPDSVALYLSEDRHVVHVGLVDDDGQTITSKWGFYHVCKHLPDRVPTSFGDKIIYAKPNEKMKAKIEANMRYVMEKI